MYPGGSEADISAVGFSWRDNYWCNLLNEHAINGQLNEARQVAIAAMSIICLSLVIFWIHFPRSVNTSSILKYIMQVSGVH